MVCISLNVFCTIPWQNNCKMVRARECLFSCPVNHDGYIRTEKREAGRQTDRERERETDTIGFYAPHQSWDNMNQNKSSSKQVQSISKRINIKCKEFKHAYANIKRKCSELVPSVLLFNKHTEHAISSTLSSNLSIPDNKNCMYNI